MMVVLRVGHMKNMIDKPVISFITWNGLEYTKILIDSLKHINFDYQLHIWDNGSIDGTVEYLLNLQNDSNKFIEIKFSDTNRFCAEPWSDLLHYAFKENNSKYCFILDSDTALTSTVNKIIPLMEKYPEYGRVYANILGKEIPLEKAEETAIAYSKELTHEAMNNPLSCTSRECFEACGYYNPELSVYFGDSEYYHRLRKKGFNPVTYDGSWIWHKANVGTGQFAAQPEANETWKRNFAEYSKIYEKEDYF